MTCIDTFDAFGAQLRAFIADVSANPAADKNRFDTLARALFRLQYEAIPIYRSVCNRRKATPDTLTHWTGIPALPTSTFKELELTSLAEGERAHVFHSSGTTGQVPSRHFHSGESLTLYEASLRPWFATHFLPSAMGGELDCLILSPEPAQAPHSSLVHMFESVRGCFGNSSYYANVGADGAWVLEAARVMESLDHLVSQKRPVALMGTAFSFVHLLDFLKDLNRRLLLPTGSRVFETGGYKGRSRSLAKPELHQLISRGLGVPHSHILSEYGMSELSSQAYDGVIGAKVTERVFQFPPWARAQIISPETGDAVDDGEIGILRIVDLANVRSVMSIQTEDLSVRRGEGFELLGRAAQAEPRGCSLLPQ